MYLSSVAEEVDHPRGTKSGTAAAENQKGLDEPREFWKADRSSDGKGYA